MYDMCITYYNIVGEVDQNGDGVIDFDEFMKMMRSTYYMIVYSELGLGLIT